MLQHLLRRLMRLLLMFELLTFHSVVLDEEAAKPSTWWKDQANRFPNVGLVNSWSTLFLDWDGENSLSCRTITSMWHCCLGITNLNSLVTLVTRPGQICQGWLIFQPSMVVLLHQPTIGNFCARKVSWVDQYNDEPRMPGFLRSQVSGSTTKCVVNSTAIYFPSLFQSPGNKWRQTLTWQQSCELMLASIWIKENHKEGCNTFSTYLKCQMVQQSNVQLLSTQRGPEVCEKNLEC